MCRLNPRIRDKTINNTAFITPNRTIRIRSKQNQISKSITENKVYSNDSNK